MLGTLLAALLTVSVRFSDSGRFSVLCRIISILKFLEDVLVLKMLKNDFMIQIFLSMRRGVLPVMQIDSK